ncbi:hypothetical protein ACT29H_08835 [Thermophagus sp. OGC60D27]|uniref:hypothetical protein n=1 Tax=Thermophagus sp. OGC60D27 TaxID=3458415 RepID=UPI0040377F09
MIVRTTRKDGIGNQLLSIRDFLVEIDSHIGREKFVAVDFRHYLKVKIRAVYKKRAALIYCIYWFVF